MNWAVMGAFVAGVVVGCCIRAGWAYRKGLDKGFVNSVHTIDTRH